MTAPLDKADRPRCPVYDRPDRPRHLRRRAAARRSSPQMREAAPVFWHEQKGAWGDGFWVVTRHADVQEVSRTPEVFSSYERGALLHTGDASRTRTRRSR